MVEQASRRRLAVEREMRDTFVDENYWEKILSFKLLTAMRNVPIKQASLLASDFWTHIKTMNDQLEYRMDGVWLLTTQKTRRLCLSSQLSDASAIYDVITQTGVIIRHLA